MRAEVKGREMVVFLRHSINNNPEILQGKVKCRLNSMIPQTGSEDSLTNGQRQGGDLSPVQHEL